MTGSIRFGAKQPRIRVFPGEEAFGPINDRRVIESRGRQRKYKPSAWKTIAKRNSHSPNQSSLSLGKKQLYFLVHIKVSLDFYTVTS